MLPLHSIVSAAQKDEKAGVYNLGEVVVSGKTEGAEGNTPTLPFCNQQQAYTVIDQATCPEYVFSPPPMRPLPVRETGTPAPKQATDPPSAKSAGMEDGGQDKKDGHLRGKEGINIIGSAIHQLKNDFWECIFCEVDVTLMKGGDAGIYVETAAEGFAGRNE